jgi:hypothetical protein
MPGGTTTSTSYTRRMPMSSHVITARKWNEVLKPYLLAAALAGVALLAATGLWQFDAGDEVAPPASSGRVTTSSVVGEGPTMTFYLVDSEQQAGDVLAMEDEAALIRESAGELSPQDIMILVAEDAQALTHALLLYNHTEQIRTDSGLTTRLIDLRGGQ